MSSTSSLSPLGQAALQYAQAGLAVFPLHSISPDRTCTCHPSRCDSPGKHPRTEHGLKDASKDPAIIEKWWQKWPNANVGVATGAVSGIIVLDVDPRHGGNESLGDLQLANGPLPATPIVRTGGGGRHLYFRHPGFHIPNSTGVLGPGLDIRGDGGYVLAPPSITEKEYVEANNEGLGNAPEWLLEHLRRRRRAPSEDKPYRQPVWGEGQRNDGLTSLAGSLRRAGAMDVELLAALEAANANRCAPPLPSHEVESIAKSVGRYKNGVDHTPPPEAEAFSNGHAKNASESVSWEMPTPFAEHDAPPFPAEVLPEWLGSYVTALATSTQTPVDLSGMLSLSVLATAAATKARIALADDWSEPLNLFTAVVLPPGSRKSAVFSAVTEPVADFEREEAERLEPQRREAVDAHEVAQGRLKHAKEVAAKAKEENRTEALEEVKRLSKELAEMKVPARFRLLADDCTPEKLVTLLQDHDGRMALLSPEGGVFELMAGRYSDAPNLEVYLKGHAGDDLRVDRVNVNRPPEFVKRPALTIGVAIQPDVLQGLKDKPGFRGRGLLGRFLYALPRNTVGSREIEPPSVPPMVRAIYHRELRTLLSLPDGAQILRLSAEAKKRHRDFMRELEPRLGPKGDLAAMADWAGKLAGAIGRIVGLLHLAEIRTRDDERISAETMGHALSIGCYLISHAQAAFAEMGADPETEGAQRILAWLKRTGTELFTKRDAHSALRATFRRAVDLDAPLTALEERGYIRPRQEADRPGAGRKRSQAYEVHPLLTQSTQSTECAWRVDSVHFVDSVQGARR